MTFHSRTFDLLVDAAVGCAPQEARALSVPPLRQLPDVPTGFGLVGPTGCGKTWLLVQHLGRHLEAIVRASERPNLAKIPYGERVSWVNWPERAEQLKREIRDTQSLEVWVDRAQWCSALYLDDLGRERTTGENDYSLGLLGEILDSRYRYNLPVFWTSNRNPEELGEFYRGRLASRLLGTWPPFQLEGEDLRLKALGDVVDFKRAAGGDA